MKTMSERTAYKSPLHEMTQTTPTCLWNDSASVQELTYSMEHGAVGATCNPVIVVEVLKKEMHLWERPYSAIDSGNGHGDGGRDRLEGGGGDVGQGGRPAEADFRSQRREKRQAFNPN